LRRKIAPPQPAALTFETDKTAAPLDPVRLDAALADLLLSMGDEDEEESRQPRDAARGGRR
jgi:hypothetical protein